MEAVPWGEDGTAPRERTMHTTVALDGHGTDIAQANIGIAAALIVWILPQRWLQGKLLLWLDAVGLAAYASFGAAKGLAFDVAPLPAVAMGVLTACLGGIIRDVLAGEPSILMRPELYVTAAALSAALTVALLLAGWPGALVGPVAFLAGFALRGAALIRGWSLPAYHR